LEEECGGTVEAEEELWGFFGVSLSGTVCVLEGSNTERGLRRG